MSGLLACRCLRVVEELADWPKSPTRPGMLADLQVCSWSEERQTDQWDEAGGGMEKGVKGVQLGVKLAKLCSELSSHACLVGAKGRP